MNEYVIYPFLDAKGKRCNPGEKAPSEGDDNLAVYRGQGLIGTEAEAEQSRPDLDVGRKGKAATRKATGKASAE